MSENAANTTYGQLTLLLSDSHAKTFQWPESEQDWQALEAACSGKHTESWESYSRVGSWLKMCQVFFLHSPMTRRTVRREWVTENGTTYLKQTILQPPSVNFPNSGMVWRGVCLTRNSSESPRDA